MESGAELDEGGDAALRDDAPRVGLVDAGGDDVPCLGVYGRRITKAGGANPELLMRVRWTARLTLVSASTRSGGRASRDKRWVSAVFKVV